MFSNVNPLRNPPSHEHSALQSADSDLDEEPTAETAEREGEREQGSSRALYLAALQLALVLSLQLVQRGPEAALLLGGHRRVGLLQQGACGLGHLQQLGLLGLELLHLRLTGSEGSGGRTVRGLKDGVQSQ